LLGVTTTYGNIDVEQATRNTLSILDLADATEVPVYSGATHRLASKEYHRREVTTRIHGQDGIGDTAINHSTRAPEEQGAVDYLIEAALQYQKELKLICVGPLTNLAKAYE